MDRIRYRLARYTRDEEERGDTEVGNVVAINIFSEMDKVLDSIWIKQAVRKLDSKDERIMAKLFYVYGLSVSEIADVFEESHKSVKRHFKGFSYCRNGVRIKFKGINKILETMYESVDDR